MERLNSPSNADGCGRLGCSTVTRAREAMQVASHVDICHDHGPAAQHDVWFAFDFGLARDFVSSILVIMSVNWYKKATYTNLWQESPMEESMPIHSLRDINAKDAARTYRLNVFRLVRLAGHWRRSG